MAITTSISGMLTSRTPPRSWRREVLRCCTCARPLRFIGPPPKPTLATPQLPVAKLYYISSPSESTTRKPRACNHMLAGLDDKFFTRPHPACLKVLVRIDKCIQRKEIHKLHPAKRMVQNTGYQQFRSPKPLLPIPSPPRKNVLRGTLTEERASRNAYVEN